MRLLAPDIPEELRLPPPAAEAVRPVVATTPEEGAVPPGAPRRRCLRARHEEGASGRATKKKKGSD